MLQIGSRNNDIWNDEFKQVVKNKSGRLNVLKASNEASKEVCVCENI